MKTTRRTQSGWSLFGDSKKRRHPSGTGAGSSSVSVLALVVVFAGLVLWAVASGNERKAMKYRAEQKDTVIMPAFFYVAAADSSLAGSVVPDSVAKGIVERVYREGYAAGKRFAEMAFVEGGGIPSGGGIDDDEDGDDDLDRIWDGIKSGFRDLASRLLDGGDGEE